MEKVRKNLPLIAFLCIVCLILGIFLIRMDRSAVHEEKLRATVLKTGKADAIVVESEGKFMLIDTGEINDAEKLVAYLKSRGVTTIEAMVITHYDKDHVGGAANVLETFNVNRVLVPDYEGSIEEYFTFQNAMKIANIVPQTVTESMQLDFGASSVRIDPPLALDLEALADAISDYDNTLSLITSITCGERSLLFCGDADRRRVMEWVGENSGTHYDFVKLPHHGKFNAALEPLLESITTDSVAITCSKKNPADEQTLALLQKYGINVFQTRDGAITVTTDGTNLKVYQD